MNKENDLLEGGILAVWGSSGSGKSIVALNIAKTLAEKKRNTLLVFADITTPMIPCLCPSTELEDEKSLLALLAQPVITVNNIMEHIITLKKNSYLTLMGTLKNENEYTFPLGGDKEVEAYIKTLREIAPYVIVDCSAAISSNNISAAALLESDTVLEVRNADIKSLSYMESQLPILNNLMEKNTFRVMNKYKPSQTNLNKYKILAYTPEIEEQIQQGRLLRKLCTKEGRKFNKAIEEIVWEVFKC